MSSVNNFKYCCSNETKVSYNIKHNPIPLEMIPELKESIEKFLWYIPGINSKQSFENDIVDNLVYSEATFIYILNLLNMSWDEDVKIVDFRYNLENDFEYYSSKACINCQKIIMKKDNNESILRSLLRHIRNSIAHGNFVPISDNIVMFLDEFRNNPSAIIKIDILKLNQILNSIVDEKNIRRFMSEEKIILNVFKIYGFKEISLDENDFPKEVHHHFDFLLEKEGNKFAVEIKAGVFIMKYFRNILAKGLTKEHYYLLDNGFNFIIISDVLKFSPRHHREMKEMGITLIDRDMFKSIKKNDVIENLFNNN